jgi:hypothetical protein
MAKQGQHKNDRMDQRKSRGHNNPDKSVTITAGTPKKQETYAEQARRGEDPGKQAQAAKNEWKEDTHDPERKLPKGAGRSGSESNAG